jgi:hypothetical protein
VVSQQAAKSGRDEPDRKDWRVLGIIHLADSRDQAIDDCTYGLQDFANYFGAAGFVPLNNEVEGAQTPRQFVEDYASKGNCCIGTSADAVAYIQDLLDRSGGFGTLLLLGHDWASPAATYHSYDLFAREVMPHFKGQLTAPQASHEWARACAPSCRAKPVRPSERDHRTHRRATGHGEADRGERLMRGSVLRGGRMVYRDDLPEPVPGPGQVLVAVKACAICGSDLHFAADGAEMLAASAQLEGMPSTVLG